MLADLILNLIYSVIAKLLSFWPTGTLPAEATSGFQQILGYSEYINNFFPLDTLWLLIGLALGIHLLILGIKLSLWTYSLLKSGGA